MQAANCSISPATLQPLSNRALLLSLLPIPIPIPLPLPLLLKISRTSRSPRPFLTLPWRPSPILPRDALSNWRSPLETSSSALAFAISRPRKLLILTGA
ncbi:MAG TPA: hypothetical protein DCQ96_02840 [Verrucomicrobiales bacterium]|nr:hypothetical protein [Verrucomicrobiales bacterium]